MSAAHLDTMAQLQASVHQFHREQPSTEPRVWCVTIKRPGQSIEGYRAESVDSLDVTMDAIERGGEGASIKVRPLIQLTFGEGRAAYPMDLHKEAALDAKRGWLQAFEDEQQRRKDWGAVTAQNSHPFYRSMP